MCALGLRPSPKPRPTTSTTTPHVHQYFILFIVPTGQGFVSSAADMGGISASTSQVRGGGSSELLSSLSKFNTTQLGCSRMRGEDASQTCVLPDGAPESGGPGGGVALSGEATDTGQMQGLGHLELRPPGAEMSPGSKALAALAPLWVERALALRAKDRHQGAHQGLCCSSRKGDLGHCSQTGHRDSSRGYVLKCVPQL